MANEQRTRRLAANLSARYNLGFMPATDTIPPSADAAVPAEPGHGRWFRFWRGVAIVSLAIAADYTMAALACHTRSSDWSPFRITMVRAATLFGDGLVLGISAALLWLLGYLARSRRWEVGGRWLLWSVLIVGFWSRLFKILIGRPRPRAFAYDGLWLPDGPTFAASFDSFPSGHAMTIFAFVGVLCGLLPGASKWLVAYAVAVSLGRVYGAAHFLTDVLAGAWLGSRIGDYCRRRWAAETAHEQD